MSDVVVIRVEDDAPVRVTVADVVQVGGGGGGGAVDSVNGDTGAVVLNQDDIGDGTTYKQYSGTEKTKLAGIATGATANATDAQLRDRSTHTGTQTASTISDFSTAADARVDVSRGLYVGVNAQTGTTYAPVLTDRGKLVTLSNASAITVTLPSDATAAFATGTQIDFAVIGAGMATFVGSSSTVNGTPSLVTRAQYSAVTAIKTAANTWLLVGDLA